MDAVTAEHPGTRDDPAVLRFGPDASSRWLLLANWGLMALLPLVLAAAVTAGAARHGHSPGPVALLVDIALVALSGWLLWRYRRGVWFMLTRGRWAGRLEIDAAGATVICPAMLLGPWRIDLEEVAGLRRRDDTGELIEVSLGRPAALPVLPPGTRPPGLPPGREDSWAVQGWTVNPTRVFTSDLVVLLTKPLEAPGRWTGLIPTRLKEPGSLTGWDGAVRAGRPVTAVGFAVWDDPDEVARAVQRWGPTPTGLS